MRTFLIVSFGLAAFGCSSSSDKPKDPPMDESTKKLVDMHTEIWNLMKLSPAAQKELNGIVVGAKTQMEKNRASHPEMFKAAPKRQPKPTHDEYVAAHKRRFDALKISAPTQTELLDAAEFCWKALHDPSVPEADRATAKKIQDMMTKLGGPPPCCDDNIFKKASPQ